MKNTIKEYYSLMQMPWGKIFYDLVYRQLALPEKPRLKILDFGSGFGVAADHYAKWHEVTAVEPNTEMTELRFHENDYRQLIGDFKTISKYNSNFDLVLCHNVIEYTPDQEEVFSALAKALKPGGRLSIIKHNTYGRAMSAAVFEENPQKALDLILDGKDVPHIFGDRRLYANSEAAEWGNKYGLELSEVFGIRTFIALIQNNEIKFNGEWYKKMLELEDIAGRIEEYRSVAFYNHLIFTRKDIFKQVESNINTLVEKQVSWSESATKEQMQNARNGRLVLTLGSGKSVPEEWIADIKDKDVLCLAGAGGLQAPLLSCADANVTVIDISEKMLEKDRAVARENDLNIRIEHGNMCDLSRFADSSFDYVINPASLFYVPDVMPVFKECFRVLRKGGSLILAAPNPIAYVCDFIADENGGYYKAVNRMPYRSADYKEQKDWIEYGHTMEDYIGGQISCGFVISGYVEEQMDDITDLNFMTKADKL